MNSAPQRLIRILLLEDVPSDAELTCRILRQAGLNIEVCLVDNEAGFRARLETPAAQDIILSDFSLPDYDGLSALILRSMLAPDLPFIFVTGSLGEERAVEMLHIGASDYVLKANLQRLPMAVLRALAESDAARIQATTQNLLNNERQLLSAVLDSSGALIVLVDRCGIILRMNPAAAAVLQRESDAAKGQCYFKLFASDDERPALELQFASLAGASMSRQVFWRATVSTRAVLWSAGRLPEHGEASGYAVISGIDVTAQEQAEQQAYYLRHFDAVTGLPNRELLILRLAHLQEAVSESHQALVMIGLSRLQEVRDSLGEDAANQLLKEVSRRLLSWQFAGDCLARVGDNSFSLLVESPDEPALNALLQEMLVLLHQPYALGEHGFFLSAYLGVALCQPESTPEAVLQAATMALHQAIQQQDESFRFYQPVLSDEARARLELEGDLHAALQAQNQLFLEYQPQVNIASGRIVGFEALMRWQHPRMGLLPPGRFIPLAEACGLIAALGDRALLIACSQAASWQAAGLPAVPVAVNLSALQWSQPGLVETIQAALAAAGLEPQWLELELTESASMFNPMATLATMEALHAMGVQISIDDFGTGFCNLSYLKRFPVDKLKIDQSFVREITWQPDDLVISQLVVAMGHLLHLQVVAEGVETEGQLTLLAEAGCDLIQGYYFSRPVSAEACAALLANQSSLSVSRRRPHAHYLLWLDPEAEWLVQVQSWLESTDYRILPARTLSDAFELLATHEIGVVVSTAKLPELGVGDFLQRVLSMYPHLACILLGADAPPQAQSIALPLESDALLNALRQAFEYYESQRGVQG